MPCRKRMIGCRTGCGHRELVTDYQQERERQETAAENDYRQRDGDSNAEPIITFQKWLNARKRY